MTRPLLPMALCALGGAACDTAERDRAALRHPDQWRVDSVPQLGIPGTAPDGRLLIGNPVGGVRLTDGTIVVGDDATESLRFFDPSGRLVRESGRSGSGPGEFADISWVGRCAGDSVFVWDGRLFRMTVFGPDGTAAREYRFPSAEVTAPPARFACSPHGAIAWQQLPLGVRLPESDGSSPHYRARLLISDTEGNVSTDLGEVPAMEMRPMGKVTSIALARGLLYVGTAESATIDVYRLDGTRISPLPVAGPRRPATRVHYQRVIDRMVAPYSDTAEREHWRDVLLGLPMPEWLPPYTGLFTDAAGLLWTLVSTPGDGEMRFEVFRHPDAIAMVVIPGEMNVFEVGNDYVLGARESADGRPHVLLYRLYRS